jgi:hypothetical protein
MDCDNNYENNIVFLSSDESDQETKHATTGINIINNKKIKKNIVSNKINNSSSSSSSSSSDSSSSDSPKSINNNKNNNGWDEDATNTINNWYELFKQQSFIYQSVLDKNKKISNKLMLASIIFSSGLGIFTSFKLWIKDETFSTVSDLLLMLSNFSIALITGYSKSYSDDKRNDLIRIYIDEVDELLGEISGQILESPIYRKNAKDFFKDHNYKYTKLTTYNPNISIYELNESMKEYEIFKKHLIQTI